MTGVTASTCARDLSLHHTWPASTNLALLSSSAHARHLYPDVSSGFARYRVSAQLSSEGSSMSGCSGRSFTAGLACQRRVSTARMNAHDRGAYNGSAVGVWDPHVYGIHTIS